MSRLFKLGLADDQANYFLTPSSSVYNNLAAVTAAAWIYPKSTGTNGIGYVLVKDPNVTDSVISDFNDTGAHWYGGAGTASSITSSTVPMNTWTHICITCDFAGDGKVRIYFNGVEQPYSSQTAGSSIGDDSGQGYSFGNFPVPDTDYGFDGRISEIAIWKVALSSTDVASLAASTTGASGISSSNLVGYWPLYGIDSPEPDISGNGNHAVASANPAAMDVSSPGRYWGSLPDTSHTFSDAVNRLINSLYSISSEVKTAVG